MNIEILPVIGTGLLIIAMAICSYVTINAELWIEFSQSVSILVLLVFFFFGRLRIFKKEIQKNSKRNLI